MGARGAPRGGRVDQTAQGSECGAKGWRSPQVVWGTGHEAAVLSDPQHPRFGGSMEATLTTPPKHGSPITCQEEEAASVSPCAQWGLWWSSASSPGGAHCPEGPQVASRQGGHSAEVCTQGRVSEGTEASPSQSARSSCPCCVLTSRLTWMMQCRPPAGWRASARGWAAVPETQRSCARGSTDMRAAEGQVLLEAPRRPEVPGDDGVDSKNPRMARAADALDSAGRPMHWGPLGHFCGVEGRLVPGRKSWEKLFGEGVAYSPVFLDVRGLGATAPVVVTRCRAEERARAHEAQGSIPTAEVRARLSWARPQVGAFPGPRVCAGGPGLMEGPAPRWSHPLGEWCSGVSRTHPGTV